MKNWNVDTSKFTSKKSKRLWELSQLVNYGLDGKKLDLSEIKDNWLELKSDLDPERARMLEYYIWGKIYSLGNKNKFWNLPQKIKQ